MVVVDGWAEGREYRTRREERETRRKGGISDRVSSGISRVVCVVAGRLINRERAVCGVDTAAATTTAPADSQSLAYPPAIYTENVIKIELDLLLLPAHNCLVGRIYYSVPYRTYYYY